MRDVLVCSYSLSCKMQWLGEFKGFRDYNKYEKMLRGTSNILNENVGT